MLINLKRIKSSTNFYWLEKNLCHNLKQPGFTYNACGPLTKYCERIQKFKETANLIFPHRSIFQFSDTGTAPFFGILNGLVKMP